MMLGIGYHVAEQHTRKGYANEAVNAFLPFMMRKLAVSGVLGIYVTENAASQIVMQRCGFVKEYEGMGK